MKIAYMSLVNYVDCASILAEGIAEDAKRPNGRISSTSIVNLANFYKASRAVAGLLEMVEADKKDIN